MEQQKTNFAAVETHLQQWQEMAKRIRDQFAPTLKQQAAIRKSIQPIIDSQKALQNFKRWKRI